jgi:alkanesulfonate monooxygenase SsuD/methylene tetrahydromethanopterin reductase-like flavin-dependent oxidoreductase (luciferase family)
MSELRQDVIDAMVKHFEDQRGHPPEQMQIEDLTDYADAVLQALTEHDDTQQVREQVRRVLSAFQPKRSREAIENGVMTVVARIVAERDAAIERAERFKKELATSVKQHVLLLEQSDRMRADVKHWARTMYLGLSEHARLNAILDAPARPTEHDESRQ